MKKKTDLEVIDIMSKKDMDVSACYTMTGAQSNKQGGLITMGVPKETFNILANQAITGDVTHYVMLLVVNKNQFDEIKG